MRARSRRFAIIAVAVAAVAWTGTATASRPVRWKDIVLQEVARPDAEIVGPVVGASADGTRVVTWTRFRRLDPTGSRVEWTMFVSTRRPAGGTWSRPRRIHAGLAYPAATFPIGRHSIAIVTVGDAPALITGDPARGVWSSATPIAPVASVSSPRSEAPMATSTSSSRAPPAGRCGC